MRHDFEYVQVITLSEANARSRRRAKKTLITGAMAASLATGLWQAVIAMLVLLAITNLVQKKKPAGGGTDKMKRTRYIFKEVKEFAAWLILDMRKKRFRPVESSDWALYLAVLGVVLAIVSIILKRFGL